MIEGWSPFPPFPRRPSAPSNSYRPPPAAAHYPEVQRLDQTWYRLVPCATVPQLTVLAPSEAPQMWVICIMQRIRCPAPIEGQGIRNTSRS
jgi:hypothetical protein